jgi:hypothetical protein
MVDVKKIQSLLKTHFIVDEDSRVQIQPDGVVNVVGTVILTKRCKQLPVTFGKVTGTFDCQNKSLTSLIGAPRHVGGSFWCQYNKLTSLEGAPDRVGYNFECGRNLITSLEHLPAHVGNKVWVSPTLDMSLLRLCMYKKLDYLDWDPTMATIMRKYVGQGKPGALKCAGELIKAGFKENARW